MGFGAITNFDRLLEGMATDRTLIMLSNNLFVDNLRILFLTENYRIQMDT
jgi:hypothetical protein